MIECSKRNEGQMPTWLFVQVHTYVGGTYMQFWCIAAAVLNVQAQETRRVFVTSLRQIVADDDGVRKVQ